MFARRFFLNTVGLLTSVLTILAVNINRTSFGNRYTSIRSSENRFIPNAAIQVQYFVFFSMQDCKEKWGLPYYLTFSTIWQMEILSSSGEQRWQKRGNVISQPCHCLIAALSYLCWLKLTKLAIEVTQLVPLSFQNVPNLGTKKQRWDIAHQSHHGNLPLSSLLPDKNKISIIGLKVAKIRPTISPDRNLSFSMSKLLNNEVLMTNLSWTTSWTPLKSWTGDDFLLFWIEPSKTNTSQE